jgi:DNA polymerase III sliding clamp (beta) subunit (PCNA family)
MQLTVDQAAADAALHRLIRIIPGKPDLALLPGIQLDAADNVLRLTTTDLTHHLTATLPGAVDEPGTTVLPADLLHDLIHRLQDACVSLTHISM